MQRATDAKTNTDNAQIKERIQLVYLAALTEGNGSLTEDSFKQELIKEFGASKITDDTIETSEDGKTWTVTIDGASADVAAVTSDSVQTGTKLGDAYEDSWIGRTIEYSAGPTGNVVNDWIILGQDPTTKDVLITTENPVGSYTVNYTLSDWCDYIDNLNTACSAYAGTIGKNNVAVKEARSITLDDINRTVGFTLPETFDTFTFGSNYGWDEDEEKWTTYEVNYYYPNENTKQWVQPTSSNTWTHENDWYYYNNIDGTYYYSSAKIDEEALTLTNLSKPDNMIFILANDNAYWVASRSVGVYSFGAEFYVANVADGGVYGSGILCHSDANGGYNDTNDPLGLRPCVVLSSDIPYDDVKDLIKEVK